ncbi:MAG TPA: hypothetical protein HPP97_08335 [Desulfuromonadales bacterium]|nr:hypothetical protein [Desulfuromonadales bacterium]
MTLSWDANSEPDLGGYKVYYTADSSSLPFDGVGAVEGTSPVDVHNLTTATISGLDPNRTYYVAVTAYDTSGLESPYSNVVAVLEAVPPSISLTSPAANTDVSGTVAITASASDNVGVSMVEFYRNGALLFASNTAPYAFSWNTTSFVNGNCTLMAIARDSAGNFAQSSSVSVTVNNPIPDVTAPTVTTFSLPSTAAALTVPVTGISASDAIGVTGYLISESATTPAATAPGWSVTAPTSFTFSGEGSKTAYAWAKDAAGNVSGSRSAATTIILPVTGGTTLSDALLALQIGSGKVTPTAEQVARLDVAPVINGISVPNGVVDTGDAIVLLSKIVGKPVL